MTAVNASAADIMTAEVKAAAAAVAPSGVDRRAARLHTTIESLLRLRQDVVSGYCRLSGVDSIEQHASGHLKVAPGELARFCELMVDYTAMGHFEVYQRIIEGKERRVAVSETAADVYPAIAETTDFLVDFNDKYDDFDGSDEEIETLAADLPKLGEIIAIRARLEDQILAALAR